MALQNSFTYPCSIPTVTMHLQITQQVVYKMCFLDVDNSQIDIASWPNNKFYHNGGLPWDLRGLSLIKAENSFIGQNTWNSNLLR